MKAFLRPQSVAVVGAGDRPTSSGGAVLANLRASGYRGRIYPVNPRGGVIQGLPAFTSLASLPEPAELVAILVRPDSILDVVREAELRALIQAHGLNVGGPNCAGTINLLDARMPFAATFFRDMPRGGGVALISQSGAIIEEAIAASHAMGIPLGAVVSVGNSVQLDVNDYLAELGADKRCGAILLYLESFGDAVRFGQVAREVSRAKPVIALIGGRTAAGRDAAFRHTGSRPADDEAVEDFCRRAGIVRVRSLRGLLLAAKAFGRYPAGIGRRLLLLSNSGGPGVLAADRAAEEGLLLPELPAAMAQRLRAALPPEAAVANPMDLLADAREDRFIEALEAALAEGREHFDALLMIHVVPFMVDAAPVVSALAARARSAGVPLMHSMMGTLPDRAQWFAEMEAAGVPTFGNVEDMCEAAALLSRHRELNRRA
jgi:acyl-CoA synthetase (NDP forming)